ncbi:MAG: hypothetical protein MZV63_69080 [Marinilabiliales bacterium]|nr:hypothetical protein [Marinilabiliales bacterium]
MADGSDETYWQSRGAKGQHITVDFRNKREFGGLQIRWLKDHQAGRFDILLSDDGARLGKSLFSSVKQR